MAVWNLKIHAKSDFSIYILGSCSRRFDIPKYLLQVVQHVCWGVLHQVEIPKYMQKLVLGFVLGVLHQQFETPQIHTKTCFSIYFGAPAPSNKVPYIITILGKISHLALYVLVIAMPITGIVGWYTESGIILPIHRWLSKVLLLLILVHICAVGFHEGILGSSLMHRMLGFYTKLKK